MKHVLSVLVENKPGVLLRVTGLISRRGFNIESLSVGPTEDPTMSRVTAIVKADDVAYEQITKQLHKLISVHKITDLTNDAAIERELVLFKVNAQPDRRNEIIEIANVFRAKIVDVGRSSLTIEATGDESKLKGMEDLFRAYGIKEITRTGKIDVYKRQALCRPQGRRAHRRGRHRGLHRRQAAVHREASAQGGRRRDVRGAAGRAPRPVQAA